MTSPAELNAARLTQQLELNRQKIAVAALQAKARNGAEWSDINDEWGISNDSIKSTRSTLQNLNAQNEGLKTQPGYVSTKVKLTTNITETTVLTNDLVEIRSTTQKSQNTVEVINNLPRTSAGTIVQNEAIASVTNGRFTTPIVGSNQYFDDITQDVKPVVASLNKPTNARLSSLSGTEDQELGDVKGSGTTSTVGGANAVRKGTDQNANRATDDDSTTGAQNTVGTASQVVEGRAAIAAEFQQTITPAPNPLLNLASQTYTVSIYLMNNEEYVQLLATDKKTLPTSQLLMQSGGAPVGERNKFFDLDFFIEDLEIKTTVGTQATNSPHSVVKLEFSVQEVNGITFLERLRQAVWDHTGDRSQTINGQNYLMVIRFFGYDDQGNLVSNAPGGAPKPEQTSDPNSLVEKFIPFQINQINYKIANEAVKYNISATPTIQMVGYSTSRGTIPFNFQLSAPDVQTLLNGNTDFENPDTANQNKKIKASTATVTQGLTQALNKHQADLAEKAPGMIPDRYTIELEDVAGLKDAKMRKQGKVNKRRAPMQDAKDVNQKLNQSKQNFDTDTKNFSITAGTQIVQLIDQVMKNSTYVTAQQTIAFDELTNKKIQNTPVKTVQWYRITQTAKPLQYDPVRKDYAYDIKYTITRYQINTPRSPYFPPAMYRGVHKLYNYWFTGQNTEVINFEVESNTNYVTPIGNSGLTTTDGDARAAEKQFFQTSADESTQGGAGESTLPAAQLASRLYSQADVSKTTITIVGDPDWITQSELFYTDSNLAPFEADGSCNMRASEVLFELRFNRPVDYDLPTGLTPVFKNNVGSSAITGEINLPEESLVFMANTITNSFKNGQFTQEIMGTLRTFNTAVDSPSQKKAATNEVEKTTATETKVPLPTARPTKKPPVPIGSRGSGEFLDTRGNVPSGTNTPPDYISGAGRPSAPKPVENTGTKVTPNTTYDDQLMRNARISSINNNSTNYVDPIINKGNWQPTVPPKPGQTVVSDDAGGSKTGFYESEFAKRKRRRRELNDQKKIDRAQQAIENALINR